MRYLILSDIHGNAEALHAVLEATSDTEHIVCLGDLVGYGASPNEVVETISRQPSCTVIRGNHDKVAAGVESGEQFNHDALQAALWTQRKLTPENREYLAQLPPGPSLIDEKFEIAHGSPIHEDQYIFDPLSAKDAFEHLASDICFFGHTHIPVVFFKSVDGAVHLLSPSEGEPFTLNPGQYLMNPGSVGQPRDRDHRASFILYDGESRNVVFRRIEYDLGAAQEKIRGAGLPPFLAARLESGM